MAEKKKKPKYVEKADEVTAKVDKAVGDTLKNLTKPSKSAPLSSPKTPHQGATLAELMVRLSLLP